jgi:murein DD-endopeptidase MepM/ murein hydrolase activator NlpD
MQTTAKSEISISKTTKPKISESETKYMPKAQLSQHLNRNLLALLVSVSTAVTMLSVFTGEVLANNWKLPFRGTTTVSGTQHTDFYKTLAIDFGLSAGSDVLAPIDAKVVHQCNAGNNHRAIRLQSSDGQLFTLIHVTTADIYNGKTYKQGDVIGKVAGDTPKNGCAYSTGPHLHFGIQSNFLVDNINLFALPYKASVTSSNGSNAGYVVREVPFTAWSQSSPLKAYSGPGLQYPVTRNVAKNSILYFSGWTYGQALPDQFLASRPLDARWYRLSGTNEFMPSAYVLGNAPGSRPTP